MIKYSRRKKKKRIQKYKSKHFSKKKIEKLEQNIESYKKIISNIEEILVRLKDENKKCEESIESVRSIINYLQNETK